MSDIKLMPCPYCGREDCSASAEDHGNTEQEKWWGEIFCQGCFTHGPDIGPEDTFDAWFEKAVEVWNSLPRHQRWTTKTPTEPGWYWYRVGGVTSILSANQLFLEILQNRDSNIEFAGPIPEPQEQP